MEKAKIEKTYPEKVEIEKVSPTMNATLQRAYAHLDHAGNAERAAEKQRFVNHGCTMRVDQAGGLEKMLIQLWRS
jgi:hypothetical protein